MVKILEFSEFWAMFYFKQNCQLHPFASKPLILKCATIKIPVKSSCHMQVMWPQNILWEHMQLGGNSCSVRFSLMQFELVYYEEQELIISSILLQNGHLLLFSMGHFCSKKVVICVLSYRLRWWRGGRWRYQDRIQASSYFGTKGRSWLAIMKIKQV